MSEVTVKLKRDAAQHGLELAEDKLAECPCTQSPPCGFCGRESEIAAAIRAALDSEDHPASLGEGREPDLSEIRCTVCGREATTAKEIGSICAFVRPGRLETCGGVLLARDSNQKGQS